MSLTHYSIHCRVRSGDANTESAHPTTRAEVRRAQVQEEQLIKRLLKKTKQT